MSGLVPPRRVIRPSHRLQDSNHDEDGSSAVRAHHLNAPGLRRALRSLNTVATRCCGRSPGSNCSCNMYGNVANAMHGQAGAVATATASEPGCGPKHCAVALSAPHVVALVLCDMPLYHWCSLPLQYNSPVPLYLRPRISPALASRTENSCCRHHSAQPARRATACSGAFLTIMAAAFPTNN